MIHESFNLVPSIVHSTGIAASIAGGTRSCAIFVASRIAWGRSPCKPIAKIRGAVGFLQGALAVVVTMSAQTKRPVHNLTARFAGRTKAREPVARKTRAACLWVDAATLVRTAGTAYSQGVFTMSGTTTAQPPVKEWIRKCTLNFEIYNEALHVAPVPHLVRRDRSSRYRRCAGEPRTHAPTRRGSSP